MHHKKRGSGSRVSAGNLLNHILYKDGYLEKLITDNYESIYKYCCYHLNQRHAAEDLTQEVFLKFLNNLDSYRDYGKIKNYLYVIAGNLIRNYYKKPKEVCIEDGGNREETVPDHAGDILDRLMVMDALSALDQTEKDIVILRYYQDQRIRDISRILGIPASTARYKLKNAEKKLKSTLEL